MTRTAGAITGSDHSHALDHAGALDPEAARSRDGGCPGILGQACRQHVEPLDSPLQGFDLPRIAGAVPSRAAADNLSKAAVSRRSRSVTQLPPHSLDRFK